MGDGTDFPIVGVASSKGGTGKSFVSANLALALARLGLKVGLLDADVDSPYLAEIVGAKGKVGLDDRRRMIPVDVGGIPVMSFALWTPDMFGGATMSGAQHETWIRDALLATDWGDLDLLVADLPAGTSLEEYVGLRRISGDRFMGLVAVAQPNVVSGLARVWNTASHHRIRILGVVENMSGPVFGGGPEGPVAAFCEQKRLAFFGSVPLDLRVREGHERGEPRMPPDLERPVEQAAAAVALRVRREVAR